MKVVAILVNYRTAEMSCRSADSTVEQLSLLGKEFKLLIVDNDSGGSDTETIESHIQSKRSAKVSGWEAVELIVSPKNGGFGAGNNFAINYSQENNLLPEYYYLINSDAFPDSKAISNLVNYLDAMPDAGIVGSYIHGVDGQDHTTAFRFPTIASEFESSVRLGFLTRLLKNYVVPLGIPDQTTQVDWLAGASMLIRSEVVANVGLFDEKFFLYFEETDLCKRALKLGWTTVYVKESSVGHIGSASTGMKTISRIPSYWLDSRRHYFSKNHGGLYFYVATTVRIFGEVIWKLRVIIENKTDPNPDRFISDLIKHTFLGR